MKAHLVYCVRDPRTGKVHTPAENLKEFSSYITIMDHEQRIRAKFEDGSEILVKPDEIALEED